MPVEPCQTLSHYCLVEKIAEGRGTRPGRQPGTRIARADPPFRANICLTEFCIIELGGRKIAKAEQQMFVVAMDHCREYCRKRVVFIC